MADLTSARMSYAAAICGTMFYGVYVVLSGICIHFLVEHRRKTRAQRVILGYTVAMLIVSTIYFVCAVKWSEVEFVEATEDIGLFATLLTSQLAIVKDTAYTVNIWLADSLLIYRLFVIFNGRTYVIAIPCLLWLGTIATGIGLLYVTANGHSLLANLTVQFQLAFYGCSVAINVITTLLIAGKLWYQERTMRRYKAHGLTTHYPVIAIVIESAALYSVLGVIFMPLVARKTPSSLVLSALIGSFTTIAPTLIILRIARGVAATSNSINTSAMTSGNGDVKLSTFRAQRSDGSRGSTTLGGTQYTPFSSSMSVPSPGEAWKDDKFTSLAAHPADNILNV